MDAKDLRIVFMGTPEFAVPSLRALVGGGYNVVGVVTSPDKPAGRGQKLRQSEVKIAALEEIAYNRGWIDRSTLLLSAERYGKSPYGEHLKRVAEGRILYDSSTTD